VLRKIQLNPSAVLYVLNALIAMLVAWGVHITTDQAGAVDTVVTGVLTITAAFLVRPVELPVIASAAVTVATAFSAFGLHLPADAVTATAAFGSIVLGFLLHLAGVPAVAASQGKTAVQLMLEEHGPGSTRDQVVYPG